MQATATRKPDRAAVARRTPPVVLAAAPSSSVAPEAWRALEAGGCACGGGCPRCGEQVPLQRTPEHGTSGDAAEVEADRLADDLVAGRAGAQPIASPPTSDVVNPEVAAVLREPGAPLDAAFRNTMEAGLGQSFGDVRVHTGARAAASARAVSALAYTVGRNVVFAADRYRPDTAPGRRLIAHELVHTVQQRGGAAVQRATTDRHGLTSVAFAGDVILERCFDGTAVLWRGSVGLAVEKVQKALVDLGHALPEFGVDGRYGDETEAAVRAFQAAAGLTGTDLDGIVGEKTIGLLDRASRRGTEEEDPHPRSEDFRITGIYSGAADEPSTIYFDVDSADLVESEHEKVTKIAASPPLPLPLTLKGMASEEGSPSVNHDLARRRIDAVRSILEPAGVPVVPRIDLAAGAGDPTYRRRRAVKVLPAGPDAPEPSCRGRATTEPCTEAQESALAKAVEDAVDDIAGAAELLPPTGTRIRSLFDELFRTDDATRAATVARVLAIFEKMVVHIDQLKNPGAHRCGNECDPTCRMTIAYNHDTGPDNAPGILTICQGFEGRLPADRARIVVHEGHHGTPGIPSRDFAYQHERMIRHIDTETALQNAATFHLFVQLSLHPDADTVGPKTPDRPEGMNTDEARAVDRALAWAEAWIGKTVFASSELYAGVRQARDEGTFRPESFRVQWRLAAPRFGLTRYPTRPTLEDQAATAAIFDRVQEMDETLSSDLTITKTETGADEWEPGPGWEVTLSRAFFALPPSRQLIVLLQELVHATPGISAALEPEYVWLIDDSRMRKGLAGPEP